MWKLGYNRCNLAYLQSRMSFVKNARLLAARGARLAQNRSYSDEMKLTFAAANKTFYDAAVVRQIDVPSFSGSFGILAKHVPTLGEWPVPDWGHNLVISPGNPSVLRPSSRPQARRRPGGGERWQTDQVLRLQRLRHRQRGLLRPGAGRGSPQCRGHRCQRGAPAALEIPVRAQLRWR